MNQDNISTQLGNVITEDEKTAALYAAFAHDLCRRNDREDETHGERAAKRFRQIYNGKLSKSMLERCLLAIKVHSLDLDPKENDPVWMLLKDADALDRGRFAAHTKKNGCCKEKLRLDLFSKYNELVKNVLWGAYWLPRISG